MQRLLQHSCCPAASWPEAQVATAGPGPVVPYCGAGSWRRAAGRAGEQHRCRGNKGSAEAAWKGEMKRREGKNRGKKEKRVEEEGSKKNREAEQGDGENE